MRWIRANGNDYLSREEIRREALGQKLDADQTQDLLDSLAKAGWVKCETTKTPGRPIQRWKVNPKLFGDTAETAESEAERGLSALRALSALPGTG